MKKLFLVFSLLCLSGCDVGSNENISSVDTIYIECVKGREYVIFVSYQFSMLDVEPTNNPCKVEYYENNVW